MRYINLTSGNYEITLLTKNEYEKYKHRIPLVRYWWWLLSPGYSQGYTAYVSGSSSVANYGGTVDSDSGAVRPALKSGAINLPVGEKFISLGNRWVVIDDHIAISDDVITHRRYDPESNVWKTSELKAWLEEWAREGEYDE